MDIAPFLRYSQKVAKNHEFSYSMLILASRASISMGSFP